jgi:hypothetical protein
VFYAYFPLMLKAHFLIPNGGAIHFVEVRFYAMREVQRKLSNGVAGFAAGR